MSRKSQKVFMENSNNKLHIWWEGYVQLQGLKKCLNVREIASVHVVFQCLTFVQYMKTAVTRREKCFSISSTPQFSHCSVFTVNVSQTVLLTERVLQLTLQSGVMSCYKNIKLHPQRDSFILSCVKL